LTDAIPVFRRLPHRVRKAIVIVALLGGIGYAVNVPKQLDHLHTFMNRKGLPTWMKKR
jgi:hypothetical protein